MDAQTLSAPGSSAGTRAAPPRARLDGLSEAFVHLAGHANVNTNQIFVLDGALERAALERSVAAAVAATALLQTRPDPGRGALLRSASVTAQLVWHHSFSGRCDLHDPSFRALLMDFSDRMRIDWRARPPVQVLHVAGVDGATSCIYLSTHHGVADARSDCLLVQAIMQHYAFETGQTAVAPAPAALPFHDLQQIRPRWYTLAGKLRRWLRAAVSVARDSLRSDWGLRVGYRGSRWEDGASRSDIGKLDFYYSVLPASLEERLKRAAKAGGVTLNTVLLAALARTMEHSQGERGGTLRMTCAVSLRRLIEPSYDATFRNYLVAANVRVPTGLPTRELLARLQHGVHEARSEPQLLTGLGRVELLLLVLRLRPLKRVARLLIDRAQGSNACYSNPGLIEEDFARFGGARNRTIQYTGFGCLIPPYDFILYTPTVNGRMQLDLVYRRASMPDIGRGFVAPFHAALDAIVDELLAGQPLPAQPT